MTLPPTGTAAASWKPAARKGRALGEMIAMMFWYGAHWAFWQVSLMWAGMIVFWGLLIWAIYALITAATRKPPPHDSRADARQILDQRLARGDIDAAEYQRLRDLIDSGDRQALADTRSAR